MRYLYNMENFLVVKVQASIRQQRIYRAMVEEEARMQAHVPTHMQSVPGPIATSAYTPSTNNHASWLFDAYLSRVHSDR
jgi:hypothetical protein